MIKDEVNVKEITQKTGKETAITLDTQLTDELKVEGEARKLIREIQMLRKEKGCRLDQHVSITLPAGYKKWPEALRNTIKRETLVKTITWADTLTLQTG